MSGVRVLPGAPEERVTMYVLLVNKREVVGPFNNKALAQDYGMKFHLHDNWWSFPFASPETAKEKKR